MALFYINVFCLFIAHRPPVEDIINFVNSEQNWLIPNIFGGKQTLMIAHALAGKYMIDIILSLTLFLDTYILTLLSLTLFLYITLKTFSPYLKILNRIIFSSVLIMIIKWRLRVV